MCIILAPLFELPRNPINQILKNVSQLPQSLVFTVSCYADLGQKIEVVGRHSLLLALLAVELFGSIPLTMLLNYRLKYILYCLNCLQDSFKGDCDPKDSFLFA